jgi:hypothetical protein
MKIIAGISNAHKENEIEAYAKAGSMNSLLVMFLTNGAMYMVGKFQATGVKLLIINTAPEMNWQTL